MELKINEARNELLDTDTVGIICSVLFCSPSSTRLEDCSIDDDKYSATIETDCIIMHHPGPGAGICAQNGQ